MNVWIDGMTVKVSVSSSAIVLNQLRHIDGGKWDENSDCWLFPLEFYDSLVEIRNQYSGHIGLKPIQINSMALLKMEAYLIESGYSTRTIKSYIRHLSKFLIYAGGRTDEEGITRYLNYIKDENKASDAYLKSAKKAVALHLKIERYQLETKTNMMKITL